MKKRSKNIPRKSNAPEVLANDAIRHETMQLISRGGQNLGIVARDEALQLASVEGHDLVLIAPNGNEGVPVAKIMDLGKALYERKKKQHEAKKKQKIVQIKEIKIRPKIGEHDFQTKINRGIEFLQAGKHLKVTLVFRGRELATKQERGTQLFTRVEKAFETVGIGSNLTKEKDATTGPMWSRIYYLKTK